jgi:hypothetical protein
MGPVRVLGDVSVGPLLLTASGRFDCAPSCVGTVESHLAEMLTVNWVSDR